MVAYRKMKGRAESEANVFAACFLMPENEFKEQFQVLNGSRAALSGHFGVPARLVGSRIDGLKLNAP
jgi:Zn-dependent peptidase ImmA (M78 family)